MFAGVGIAFGDLGRDGNQAFVFEAANGACGGAGKFYQFLEGHFAALFDDVPDFFLTFRQFGKLAIERKRADVESLAPASVFVANSIGKDGFERDFGSAAVVLANPASELEDFGRDERLRADDFEDGLEFGAVGCLSKSGDAAEHLARAKRNLDAAAHADLSSEIRGNGVIELFPESEFEGNASDHLGGSIPYSGFSFQFVKAERLRGGVAKLGLAELDLPIA